MSWNEVIWKKYMEGKATKEELETLESYFRSGELEEWTAFVAKEQLPDVPMPSDKEKKLRQYLLQQINKSQKRTSILPIWSRVAAAAAVIIILIFLTTRSRHEVREIAVVTGWDTIGHTVNSIRVVTLKDGTKVWLNRQSELLISKAYPKDRSVQLKGEGYFEVATDGAHPFSVQTALVQTVVLGTAFNVEYTHGDKAVRVSLLKGKVKVMHQQDTTTALTLLPGHMAIASDSLAKISSTEIDVATAAAWIQGDLVMNNIPLADALDKLAIYYNIQITCHPGLAEGKTVTALYHRHQSWKQVLQHMLFIAQLKYVIDKNGTILITH